MKPVREITDLEQEDQIRIIQECFTTNNGPKNVLRHIDQERYQIADTVNFTRVFAGAFSHEAWNAALQNDEWREQPRIGGMSM